MAGEQGDRCPYFLEIVGFSEILMFRRKISVLPLVKIRILHFMGKFFEFAPPPYSTGATTPLCIVATSGR